MKIKKPEYELYLKTAISEETYNTLQSDSMDEISKINCSVAVYIARVNTALAVMANAINKEFDNLTIPDAITGKSMAVEKAKSKAEIKINEDWAEKYLSTTYGELKALRDSLENIRISSKVRIEALKGETFGDASQTR